MKKLIIAISLMFVAFTVQAAPFSTTDLIVGGAPYYDIRSRATLTAADTAAVAAGKGLVCASTYTISTATTITSSFTAEKGCTLVKSGTGTIAFSGPFSAGLYQVFSGFSPGDVTGLKEARPEWFGGAGDNSTDNATPIACAAASGGRVYIDEGTYLVKPTTTSTGIASLSSVRIQGKGAASIIKLDWTGATTNVYYVWYVSGDDVSFDNLTFDGNKSGVPFSLNPNTTFRLLFWYRATNSQAVARFNLNNLKLINFPGCRGGAALESVDTSVACYNSHFTNITKEDCDTTFAISGNLSSASGNQVDDETYWSHDITVDNFINRQSSLTNYQWMAFGTYGVKRIVANNLVLYGAQDNGLNIEFTEDGKFYGVISQECKGSGVNTYGYVNRVEVFEPNIINCGSNYPGDTAVASVSMRGAEWWDGNIDTNPVDVVVTRPTISNSTSTAPAYFVNRRTPGNAGSLYTEHKKTGVIVKKEHAFSIAQTTNSSAYGAWYTVLDDFNYGPPEDISIWGDPSAGAATVTKTLSATDLYYALTTTSQFRGKAFYLPGGVDAIYAVKAKVKVVLGTWSLRADSGGGTVRFRGDLANATTDYIDTAFVVRFLVADTAPVITFMNGSAGGVSSELHVKDVQIAAISGTPQRLLTNFESVLADVGNSAKTCVAGTTETTIIYNTAITADRAVTLSTSTVFKGARFRVIRTANATGAFNVNVGTGPLKALAAGQWCDVEYNGSAWVLTAYGTL